MTESIDDLGPLVSSGRRFPCVYADPPWQYDNRASRGAAENHYATMSVDEICAMPISNLVADGAHLHLWVTNAFLFEGFRVLEAWGFRYASSFVWLKPHMGCGNYWRNAHEILLLGVRGELSFRCHPQSCLKSPRRRHSEKPESVRLLIESVSPGPRLELFGRTPAEGWTVYGNEVATDYLFAV